MQLTGWIGYRKNGKSWFAYYDKKVVKDGGYDMILPIEIEVPDMPETIKATITKKEEKDVE